MYERAGPRAGRRGLSRPGASTRPAVCARGREAWGRGFDDKYHRHADAGADAETGRGIQLMRRLVDSVALRATRQGWHRGAPRGPSSTTHQGRASLRPSIWLASLPWLYGSGYHLSRVTGRRRRAACRNLRRRRQSGCGTETATCTMWTPWCFPAAFRTGPGGAV